MTLVIIVFFTATLFTKIVEIPKKRGVLQYREEIITISDMRAVGFDKFQDDVLGIEDGVEKTAWAAKITGVPSRTGE